jgi:hypothetical protein
VHPPFGAVLRLMVVAVIAPVWLAGPNAVAQSPTLRLLAEADWVVVKTVDLP